MSLDMSGADLIWRLQNEGNEVKTYIHYKKYRHIYDGLVDCKVVNWRKELRWIGRDGLVVFDNNGFGVLQDKLRNSGFKVFGGSAIGDDLENDREFGQRIFKKAGLKIKESKTFFDFNEAIRFIGKNRGQWVFKQNNQLEKDLNYVGCREDGADMISLLEFYKKTIPKSKANFILQKKAFGLEIGVGRFFNGKDWVGPIEYNMEHKALFPGELGPKTFEMGDVMWYDDEEENKLYIGTLAKMRDFLRKMKFVGDFEINCIVNKNSIIPLEATTRIGYPAVHLQSQFQQSPWGEFLYALANGDKYKMKWRKGEGLVVLVAVPPFPYIIKKEWQASQDMRILIDDDIYKRKRNQIHFEEIYKQNGDYYASSERGQILHVSAVGKDLSEARKEAYGIIKKIHIPKMFYRDDIGESFITNNKKQLIDWGYIA